MEKELLNTFNKDLLLKDLSARLPYKIKCEVIRRRIDGEIVYIQNGSGALELTFNNIEELVTDNLYEIKPYLFPLSSMTDEQKQELTNLVEETVFQIIHSEDGNPQPQIAMDWYNENHFDYRGLIPMGIANDATGLNIY